MPYTPQTRRIRYLKYRQEEIDKVKSYREKNPWSVILVNIRQRCTNPKTKAYKYYGAKGIQCFLTMEDIKTLWFRDKAYEMIKPSIDRKDSKKSYTLENCQFIEHVINSSKREY